MKKFILILILSIFLCSNAFASCRDDLEVSWIKEYGAAKFTFLNNGPKNITIKKLKVYNKDILLKERKPAWSIGAFATKSERVISKFGEEVMYLDTGEFQQRFVTSAGYTCSY